MISAKDLKAKATGKWFGIYEYFNIVVGTGKHMPCPICGGTDRFRVEKDGSGYYCNQCGAGDGISLVMKHIGINLTQAIQRINEILGGNVKMDEKHNKNGEMTIEQKKAMLNKLWTSSKELLGGDHACKYLHSRGLVLQPNNVRFCPECWESEKKETYPAMVAKIVDKNSKPLAIHRTYLDPFVAKQADIKSSKKMTPAIDSLVGSAVRLFPPENKTLIVCEGIETGIACHQLFDGGVYSCMSSTILEGFEPPASVKKIIICADNDANFTGQTSAFRLAKRLYKDGFVVEVRIPERVGADFADELWMSIK